MSETDEDGRFRFPNLMPGTYYLAVGPSYMENRLVAAGEMPKLGFPSEYYPGVAELSAALPIQLNAGQQAETDFSLNTVPLYKVSGSVTGHPGEQGVGFQVLNQSGDELSLPTTFDMDSGTFHMESVPAGSYVLRAISQTGTQTLRAQAQVNIASNLDNVRLVLGPAISILIVVRLESRDSSNANGAVAGQRPPVSVRLLPQDASSAEAYSTFEQRSPGHDSMMVQNLDPGTYAVDIMPQAPWYAQSATYGQSNLLYDDLLIAAGQSYPLEIVLRNDSASLTGSVKSSDGTPSEATIIVAPQPVSKVMPRLVKGTGNFAVSGLPPGEYLVYAFDHLGGMEYGNPDVLQPYASRAAHISLSPNQQAQVSVDLIHVGKGD
jgi:hypothetical protein